MYQKRIEEHIRNKCIYQTNGRTNEKKDSVKRKVFFTLACPADVTDYTYSLEHRLNLNDTKHQRNR